MGVIFNIVQVNNKLCCTKELPVITSHTNLLLVTTIMLTACTVSVAEDAPVAFPITLRANDVHLLTDLNVAANGLRLTAKSVTITPIRCEKGITGCILLGDGEFHFTPKGKAELHGQFRGALLRFNPDEQPKMLPLDTAKVVTDHGAHAMSSHLVKPLFNHCWQSNGKALIPDSGVLAVSLYAKDYGDLLISTGSDTFVVYNFSQRKRLYADK